MARAADQTIPVMSLTTQIVADRISIAGDHPLRLEHFGFKVYSQSDEDGIIEEVFRRIGIESRVFVDFGAETGTENNSRYLLAQGWRGLWIEFLPQYAPVIREDHKEALSSGQLKFVEAGVTAENINDLIRNAGITGEVDFLSVDIDGNDFHVFEAIDVIRPRVVCLEHNQSYVPPTDWVMPYNPEHRWTGDAMYGASIVALERLARSKGYILVGCSLYSPNGYYLRADLVTEERFTAPYTAERFFHPCDYDKIMSYPRDEARFGQIQCEAALSKIRSHHLEAQIELQRLNDKLKKFREKCSKLQQKLDAATRPKVSSWLPKWLRR